MTNPVYEVIENNNGTQSIQRTDSDGEIYSIPFDPANSDYQRYLDRDKPKAALSTPSV